MPDGPPGTYQVVYFPDLLKQLKQWAQRAVDLGLADQFRAALKSAQDRLQSDPMTWGDPLYRLRHLGLVVHHRVEPLFHVLYAVDENRRVVYVKNIKPRPGHPLGEQEP
jgi:hypothetical protein